MPLRLSALGLTVIMLLTACAASAARPATEKPRILTVFAAASLTEAFTEIGQAFEAAQPGVTVAFNFGASNQLAQQIAQGAPADVFASANRAQMLAAIEAGRVVSGTQQTFARNRLVVIFPIDNPGGLTALHDLARPGLTLVLAAKEVPVGQYSLDFLDKASQASGFGASCRDDVLKNVVSYEENVRAVFSKVALGEADAGIVYTSDIVGAGAEALVRLAIPDAMNTIATYPLAVISDSANAELAQLFVALVLSPEGQDLLARYGFIPAASQ